MKSKPEPAAPAYPRLQLLRDVLVFQVKLVVDGFRDLLLVPVSIIAGLFSLIGRGPEPGPQFYDLLRFGRKSEHWINLFGAIDSDGAGKERSGPPADIDDLVARVESFIVDEYQHGGISGQARQRLDRALESLRARRTGRTPPP